MAENPKAAEKDENWAVFPFDEAEDERRWDELIAETDKLIAKTESTEAVYGKIPMDADLPPSAPKQERQTEDEDEFAGFELF